MRYTYSVLYRCADGQLRDDFVSAPSELAAQYQVYKRFKELGLKPCALVSCDRTFVPLERG